jgi:hypothetical protein
MSSPCTLTGGAFQDSEGNVLALGYLKFRLSQDASVNASNICSGVEVTIQLDSDGNVVGGSEIWGNDALSPINTFYRVTGFTHAGQPAWGPNNQQVTGSSFDLGSWIPNLVISWNPPPSGITLENNGTLNSSQTVLNLESSDSSVSISDAGGGTIDFTVGGVGPSQFPDFMFGIGNFSSQPGGNGVTHGVAADDVALRVYAQRFNSPTSFSFSELSFTAGSNLGGGGSINVALYSDTGSLLAQTGAIAIGNFVNQDVDMALSPAWAEPAGNYYIAWAITDNGNTTMWGWNLGTVLINSGTSSRNLLNRNSVVNFGYSPNPATSGVASMPSSLGSLVAAGSGNNTGTPAFLFQK